VYSHLDVSLFAELKKKVDDPSRDVVSDTFAKQDEAICAIVRLRYVCKQNSFVLTSAQRSMVGKVVKDILHQSCSLTAILIAGGKTKKFNSSGYYPFQKLSGL
jgi:hypothetical protein